MSEKRKVEAVHFYLSCDIVVETKFKNKSNFSQISYTRQMTTLPQFKQEKVGNLIYNY